MDKILVTKLRNLNQQFYSKSANSFDSSRKYPWEGWGDLWSQFQIFNNKFQNTELETHNSHLTTLKVLDVGCGNGRFALFLKEKCDNLGYKLDYIGIDFSQELLDLAEKSLEENSIKSRLIKVDLLGNWGESFSGETFDLVMCSAVLHHIPGFKNRKILLSKMSKFLSSQSMLVVTVWRFALFERFQKIFVPDSELKDKLGVEGLEKNDYILEWNRGDRGLRYCHYTDEEEFDRLVSGIGVDVVESFVSDGKTRDLNKYYLLRPQL